MSLNVQTCLSTFLCRNRAGIVGNPRYLLGVRVFCRNVFEEVLEILERLDGNVGNVGTVKLRIGTPVLYTIFMEYSQYYYYWPYYWTLLYTSTKNAARPKRRSLRWSTPRGPISRSASAT